MGYSQLLRAGPRGLSSEPHHCAVCAARQPDSLLGAVSKGAAVIMRDCGEVGPFGFGCSRGGGVANKHTARRKIGFEEN